MTGTLQYNGKLFVLVFGFLFKIILLNKLFIINYLLQTIGTSVVCDALFVFNCSGTDEQIL